jgi:hypothetical protein
MLFRISDLTPNLQALLHFLGASTQIEITEIRWHKSLNSFLTRNESFICTPRPLLLHIALRD